MLISHAQFCRGGGIRGAWGAIAPPIFLEIGKMLAFHTGVLDLNIISKDTILLIISISTTFVPLVISRVSNEAKFFQEVKF